MTRRGGARKRRAKASAAARAAAATPRESRLGVATMFACLPNDALCCIFFFISGWEAALLAEVARAWRDWIRRDARNWKSRFFRDFHAVADARAERERLEGIFDCHDLDGALDAIDCNYLAYQTTGSRFDYSAALDMARPFVLRLWEDETRWKHLVVGSTRARELRLLRPREICRGYHALELPTFVFLNEPDDEAYWQGSPDFAKAEQALDDLFALSVHKDGLTLHNMYNINPAPGYKPSRLLPDGTNGIVVDFTREADECRVCNNDRCSNCAEASGCHDEHPVLGVPMCALPSCQGQYPTMLRSAACEELAAVLHISMAEAQHKLNAVACSPADPTYHASRRTRRLMVLRSSLEALIWASLSPLVCEMTRRGGARVKRAKTAAAARDAAAAAPPAACAAPRASRLGVATMFACLPDDALRRIFSHLLGFEAARLMGVARAWRSWIQRDAVNWERRFFRDFHAVTAKGSYDERKRLEDAYRGLGEALDDAAELLETYENTGSRAAYCAALTALYPFEQRYWEDETQRTHVMGSIPAREIFLLRPREWWRCRHPPKLTVFDPDHPLDQGFSIILELTTARSIHLDELRVLHDHGMGQYNMYSLRFAPQPDELIDLFDHLDMLNQTRRIGHLVVKLLGSGADESADWRLLYTEAAAQLLKGKCRVCINRRHCSGAEERLDVHPVLGVRMCALPCCQGRYPTMLRSAACEELAAALHISMAEARQKFSAVACSEAGRTYRTRPRLRRPKVLRSSLEALIWASLSGTG